jgi:hypothetical protein
MRHSLPFEADQLLTKCDNENAMCTVTKDIAGREALWNSSNTSRTIRESDTPGHSAARGFVSHCTFSILGGQAQSFCSEYQVTLFKPQSIGASVL